MESVGRCQWLDRLLYVVQCIQCKIFRIDLFANPMIFDVTEIVTINLILWIELVILFPRNADTSNTLSLWLDCRITRIIIVSTVWSRCILTLILNIDCVEKECDRLKAKNCKNGYLQPFWLFRYILFYLTSYDYHDTHFVAWYRVVIACDFQNNMAFWNVLDIYMVY